MSEPKSKNYFIAEAEAMLRESYGPIKPAIQIGLRLVNGLDTLNDTMIRIADTLDLISGRL